MAVKKDPRMSEPLEEQGPGAYLRDAREKAGMTVDAVAASLLLKSKTLDLLEADDYACLPAPTFVRGYLRGYARVLGLPSGPILEMYDRQGFEPPPLNTDATESAQAHAPDIPARLVTYAVVAVLVVLVGLWWHSQGDGDSQGDGGFSIGDLFDPSRDAGPGEPASASTSTDEEPGKPPEGSGAGAAPGTLFPDRTDDPPREYRSAGDPHVGETEPGGHGPAGAADPVRADTGAERAPAAVASVRLGAASGDPESASPPPAEEAASGGTAPGEPAPGADPASPAMDGGSAATRESRPESVAAGERGDGAIPGAGGDDAPAAERTGAAEPPGEPGGAPLPAAPAPETEEAVPAIPAGSTAVAGGAPSGLVLEFVHESWVEVYDRERVRLFFNLVQPGRVLELDGPQPFDVLLGYGKDVRVTIDGEAFDIKPYLNHGVARFSVSSESAGGAATPSQSAAQPRGPVRRPAPDPADPDR